MNATTIAGTDRHEDVVVVGYIPTPPGERALQRGIEEARRRDAVLIVVNTTTGDRYADTDFASDEQLSTLQRSLADSGVTHEIRRPIRGRGGAEELLDTAAEVDADLLVIGLRKRSAVGKLLLGSNAQTVILRAECDVLAVKP